MIKFSNYSTLSAVLMKVILEYLGCGHYYLKTKQDVGDIIVSGLSDNTAKINPFFEKYPIVGVKALDFSDFCKALKLKIRHILQNKG